MIHELKTWPEPFFAVKTGAKRFEVRQDDRGFGEGDTLCLRQWDPERQAFTGEVVAVAVTYLVRGPAWGLPAGLVVMSITKLPKATHPVERFT